jgi:AcrR family transcriptional regulator
MKSDIVSSMDMLSIVFYSYGMLPTDIIAAPVVPSLNPRRAATHARISAAANQLFFERGFPLVTMEQIASAAGIQRSTLYLHFREKDEILAAIADDYTAKLSAVIARLPGPVPTHEELGQWVDEFATFVSGECAATELLVSLSHLPNAPLAALEFGQALLSMMAKRLVAIREALEPGNDIKRAWMIAVMDTLGWALCNHARHGVNPMSQARLAVAAEGLNRFVRGEL